MKEDKGEAGGEPVDSTVLASAPGSPFSFLMN